jgi:hypothetical protein
MMTVAVCASLPSVTNCETFSPLRDAFRDAWWMSISIGAVSGEMSSRTKPASRDSPSARLNFHRSLNSDAVSLGRCWCYLPVMRGVHVIHRHLARRGQHHPNPRTAPVTTAARFRSLIRASSQSVIINSLVSEYHTHRISVLARPFQAFRSAFRRAQTPRNPAAIKVAIRSLTAR